MIFRLQPAQPFGLVSGWTESICIPEEEHREASEDSSAAAEERQTLLCGEKKKFYDKRKLNDRARSVKH